MKKILKRLLILSCVLCTMLSLAGCGGKKIETPEIDEAQVRTDLKSLVALISNTEEDIYYSQIADLDNQNIEMGVFYGTANAATGKGVSVDGQAFKDGVVSFITAKKELGDVDLGSVADEDITIKKEADEVGAVMTVTGSKNDNEGNPRKAEIEFTLDYKGKVTSAVINIKRPLSENMANAGLNTLLGMGTVFVVLIVIALIIYCFRFISLIEAGVKEKKEAPKEKVVAMDSAVAQIIENEQRSDDLELIAVITAAIAAYESAGNASGTTVAGGDGYVVRSIKRIR